MDARHGVRYAAAMPLLFRITIQERRNDTKKSDVSRQPIFKKQTT